MLCALDFTELKVLRRFTLRVAFTQTLSLAFGCLPTSTIASPVFSEFVIEVGGVPPYAEEPCSAYWGYWERSDTFLERRFGSRGGFKFIVRTSELQTEENFQRQTKEAFPMLTSRGCIHFETSPLIKKYLR
jgi:hypothetical protein